MARVGVDIDGVLYPFDVELKKALIHKGRRYKYELPPPTKWEFFEDWRMSRECFVGICNDYTNSGDLFKHGDPYPGVGDQLQRLAEAGHRIVLITNRNFGDEGVIQGSTRDWLYVNAIPYHELHFVKDKTTIEVDYHIDDKAENHIAMRGHGVKSFLLNQPWNRTANTYYRVDSVEAFVSHILRMDTAAPAVSPSGEWVNEREDVLARFQEELSKATGDGSKKRQAGLKPPWYEDVGHEGAIFSHLMKWKRGETVDPDSGAHPLVHAAWRCLAIACSESGNHP